MGYSTNTVNVPIEWTFSAVKLDVWQLAYWEPHHSAALPVKVTSPPTYWQLAMLATPPLSAEVPWPEQKHKTRMHFKNVIC